jgi:hypothetical protein
MLVGPWAVGGLFGWRFSGTWLKTIAVIALGLVLTAAGLAAFLLTAAPSAEEACGEDECVRYFGRWLEATLAREWPVYTAAAWSTSAVFFSWIRRSDSCRFRKGAIAAWALGLFGLGIIGSLILAALATR